jgi:hypothetical protein
MTFVEQRPQLRWGANLRVQRKANLLHITGNEIVVLREPGKSDDLWDSYLSFPTNWSADRANQAPHIQYANANTDDELVAFVERFGPVIASVYEMYPDEDLLISASQDMDELRNEQILYSAAMRLLSELQRHEKSDGVRIVTCVREIVSKVQMWPTQWARESRLRAAEHTKPPWEFQQVDLEGIENYLGNTEWALSQPPPKVSDIGELFGHWLANAGRDPLSLGQSVLCTLINAFPVKLQPIGHGRVVEWPDHDISYGIRPLLYHILRRTWLVGSVGICANERCRKLFEFDRMPYCSRECSQHERQRRYWSEKGSARRQKRKRRQKVQNGKQKTRPSSNLVARQKPASKKEKEAHTRTQALTRLAQHEKEIAARAKGGAGAPISKTVKHTSTANRETESLASTIKKFRGAGPLRKGKGSA